MTLDTSILFEPLTINGVTLRNRIVMPAMQRAWGQDGQIDDRTLDYYRERAAGGTGLLVTESLAIDHPTAYIGGAELRINNDTRDGWERCVKAIHAEGAAFLMQLWHIGAVLPEGEGGLPGVSRISPSGLFDGQPRGVAASRQDLEELKAAWVAAATTAMDLGADGVEIHMAHGYLLHQFLWDQSNVRTDGYGGDAMADRVRFPAEVVAAVRAAVGPEAIVSCRFSQWAEWDYDAKVAPTPADLRVLVGALESAGVDIFNVSTRYLSRPEWPDESELPLAGWIKSMTSKHVVAVGSVGLNIDFMSSAFTTLPETQTLDTSIGDAVTRMKRGEFDLLAVGRSIIGDPEFAAKVQQGRLSDIRQFTRADLSSVLADVHLPDEIRDNAGSRS